MKSPAKTAKKLATNKAAAKMVTKTTKKKTRAPAKPYQRKTRDRYAIMTNYGYGWEEECSEETFAEARRTAKDYIDNTNAAVVIVKRREPITGNGTARK